MHLWSLIVNEHCRSCGKPLPEYRIRQHVFLCNALCQDAFRNGITSEPAYPVPIVEQKSANTQQEVVAVPCPQRSIRNRFEQVSEEYIPSNLPSWSITTRPEGNGNQRGGVYVIFSPRLCLHKIGKSKNVANRLTSIRVNIMDRKAHVVFYLIAQNMDRAERYLHQRYSYKRIEGEWFDLSKYDVAEIASFGKNYHL